MNNLIIYSDLPLFNSVTAAGNRMTKYAKAIASNNCRVFIVSNNSIPQSVSQKLIEFSQNCFFIVNSNNSRISSWSFIRFINRFAVSLGEKRTWLYYPSNCFMLDILSTVYLKYFRGEKVFIEVNERRLYYKNKSVFRNVPFVRLPEVFIKYLYTKCSMAVAEMFVPYYDGAVFISKNIESHFKNRMKRKKYVRIPILCEPENQEYSSKELKPGSVFKMAFSGRIHVQKENLNLLFIALGMLKEEGYRFNLNLYGPIINRPYIKKLITENNISLQVKYCGNIDYQILQNELQNNHLLLLVRGKTRQNNFGFSTKLSDYLKSGVPLLVTKVSDNGIYLKDLKNAFVINPDSEFEIFEKIKFIINNYNKYAPIVLMGANNLVNREFAYCNHGNKLLSLFFNN